MRLVGFIRWVLRRYPARFLWALALIWLALAFRHLSGTSATLPGLVDDLSVFAGGLLLFALLERAPRGVRAAGIATAGTLLVALHLSALLYFRFYQAFLAVDTLRMAPEAAAARTAVLALVTPATLLALVVAPLALTGASAVASHRYRRRRALPLAATMLVAVAMLGSVHARTSQQAFSPSENNPLMFLLRDAVSALRATESSGRDGRLLDLVARREETYHRSGRYQWGPWVDYPLLRLPKTPAPEVPSRRNVVLLLMESFRGAEPGLADSGNPVIAPNLSRLAARSLHFPNLYFNASQTAPAEVAVLCSLLPASSMEILYLSAPGLAVKCLPHILAESGYSTYWFKGFRGSFMGAESFLVTHGIDSFFDEDDFRAWGPRRPPIGWGVSDEDLFDFALEKLRDVPEPFFAGLLTLSNHFPLDIGAFGLPVPEEIRNAKGSDNYRGYLMGMHYTDHAVGAFLDSARREPWFSNTLFVILGDHGIWTFPEDDHGAEPPLAVKIETYLRAGLLLWVPGVVQPGRDPVVGSQIDIAPTILDLLGIEAPNSFQGVSLLADEVPPEKRFALFVGKSSWSFREGNDYCYALAQSCFVDAPPSCPPGVEPERASHACFRVDKDLLAFGRQRLNAKLLNGPERHRLVTRARRLIDDTTFLVSRDRLFPRASE